MIQQHTITLTQRPHPPVAVKPQLLQSGHAAAGAPSARQGTLQVVEGEVQLLQVLFVLIQEGKVWWS